MPAAMSEPIVLYGGTFDPVHHGHLIAARAVAEARGYRRVLLLPAARPPHKAAAGASATHRLAMLRLAVEGEPLFEVNDVELRRQGPSFTCDTLCALRAEHPEVEIHLIIGTDMLRDLPRWHRAKDVVEAARIVVAARPPLHSGVGEVLRSLADTLGEDAASRIAENVLPTPMIDISATDIRRRVAEGRSIRFLVPEAVRAYVEAEGLYRPSRNPEREETRKTTKRA